VGILIDSTDGVTLLSKVLQHQQHKPIKN